MGFTAVTAAIVITGLTAAIGEDRDTPGTTTVITAPGKASSVNWLADIQDRQAVQTCLPSRLLSESMGRIIQMEKSPTTIAAKFPK